jgi:hypothetical protein
VSAQQIHTPASDEAARENAPDDSPAQESSGGTPSSGASSSEPPLTVDEVRKLNRLVQSFFEVCDLCALHGWPKDGPVYPWLEQQLAELDRRRAAAVDEAIPDHPANRG